MRRFLAIFPVLIFIFVFIPATSFSVPLSAVKELKNGVADIATQVQPAVVNISSVRIVPGRQGYDPFQEFFGDEFYRRFFEVPRSQSKQTSLGSGVIVDEAGYIVTNYHVVKGADEITVKLSDKREFTGKIIGTDEKTDLAIIKIKAKKLTAVKLGDSDTLRVGEWAVAIGNPFALSQTVTLGIISAKGRSNVGLVDYEDFIQTDAAINPGNSGGALLNIKGELIGINTAIFSRSGGYQGIGFAIPVNMVRTVMESLIEHGKIVRGWLGVSIQDIDKNLAKQFGIESLNGVLISDVVRDSPAKKAGLKRGDVILEFNGSRINDAASLRNKVASTPVGKKVDISIIRNKRNKVLTVKIGKLKGEPVVASDYNRMGTKVQTLTKDLIEKMHLNIDRGVVVTDVKPGSNSENAGIKRGDVILEMNQSSVSSAEEVEDYLRQLKAGDTVLLLINRGRNIYYTVVSVK